MPHAKQTASGHLWNNLSEFHQKPLKCYVNYWIGLNQQQKLWEYIIIIIIIITIII
jgi:hypothetical protein